MSIFRTARQNARQSMPARGFFSQRPMMTTEEFNNSYTLPTRSVDLGALPIGSYYQELTGRSSADIVQIPAQMPDGTPTVANYLMIGSVSK